MCGRWVCVIILLSAAAVVCIALAWVSTPPVAPVSATATAQPPPPIPAATPATADDGGCGECDANWSPTNVKPVPFTPPTPAQYQAEMKKHEAESKSRRKAAQ